MNLGEARKKAARLYDLGEAAGGLKVCEAVSATLGVALEKELDPATIMEGVHGLLRMHISRFEVRIKELKEEAEDEH